MRQITYRRITAFFAVLIAAVIGSSAYGQSSVFLWNGGGGVDLDAASGATPDYYPFLSTGFRTSTRVPLANGGLWASSAGLDLRYYSPPVEDLQDDVFFDLELRQPAGPHRIDLGIGGDARLWNLGRGAVIRPDWHADFRWNNESAATTLGYFGGYRLFTDTDGDRLITGARIGTEFDRSLSLTIDAELRGSWDYYPEWHLLADDGSLRAETRNDARSELRIATTGLIGYFHAWEAELSGGVLLSSANRVHEDSTEAAMSIEDNSESRAFSRLAGTILLSPNRQVAVEGSVGIEGDSYFDRTYGGERVDRLGIDGFLRVDYTPNDAVFFVLDLGGGWETSTAPSFSGAFGSASVSVEYAF